MKMLNKIMVLVLGLFLLMVAGCSQGGTGSGQTTSKAFIGGTTGLAMNFLEGAPPESVFDTDFMFSINVRAENKGEWDLPAGDVTFTITGINPEDFGVTAAQLTQNSPDDLPGSKLIDGNIIQGGVTNIEFNDLQYQGTVNGQVQFNIKSEACYKYGTKVQTQLCILEDLLGRTGEDQVCNPTETKPAESSGGPVYVMPGSFKQSVIGNNKLAFDFVVKHAGAGNVYETDTDCNPEWNRRNKVYVRVIDPGLGTMQCQGLEGSSLEGLVTLYEGQRSVRCTLELDPGQVGNFQTVLNVELTYDYKDAIDTPLVVKQSS